MATHARALALAAQAYGFKTLGIQSTNFRSKPDNPVNLMRANIMRRFDRRDSFSIAGLLLVAWCLTACSLERREIARIVSPDHNTSAILVWEYGGGAAGSSEHHVYLMETGSKESAKQPVLVATHCGPSISWSDSHTLQINYQADCSIRKFQNKWHGASDTQNARHSEVEIILNRIAG
jgi:hypothetical protein